MSAALFIGDVALDEYFAVDRWPGPGDKARAVERPAEVGGMIANAASVHAALGGSTRFRTTMNDGALSRRLLAELADRGIDVSHCVVDDSLADSRCLIYLVDGEHVVFIPEIGELRHAFEAGLDELAGVGSVFLAVGDARALVAGELAGAAVLEAFRSRGIRVVMDLDVAELEPGDEQILAALDVCIVNATGFERLRGGRTAADAVRALFDGGLSVLVRTLAEDGCLVHLPGEEFAVPGIPADVVDVTGAGDTFAAAFLFAMDRCGSLRDAALFATAAGSLATEAHGARAGAAGLDAVLARLERHGVDASRLRAELAG